MPVRNGCLLASPPNNGRTVTSTPASRAPRSYSTKRSWSNPPATTRWRRAVPWRRGRTASVDGVRLDPERRSDSSGDCAVGRNRRRGRRAHLRIHRRRLREQRRRRGIDGHSGAAREKASAPVMMRISREEGELYRPRADQHDRPREDRLYRDGRITALDLFILQDSGAYGPMGDHRSAGNAASLIYQPPR